MFRRGYLGLAYSILAVLVVYLIAGNLIICRKGVSMDTYIRYAPKSATDYDAMLCSE